MQIKYNIRLKRFNLTIKKRAKFFMQLIIGQMSEQQLVFVHESWMCQFFQQKNHHSRCSEFVFTILGLQLYDNLVLASSKSPWSTSKRFVIFIHIQGYR